MNVQGCLFNGGTMAIWSNNVNSNINYWVTIGRGHYKLALKSSCTKCDMTDGDERSKAHIDILTQETHETLVEKNNQQNLFSI